MTLLFAFTAALCTSLVLTPLARAVAHRFSMVDRPDGQRKLQSRPVALWGGIAVYCGLCAGLASATLVRSQGQPIPARLSLLVIVSGGLLGLVGLIDDTHNLRARSKLVLQIVAVSPLIFAGFYPRYALLLGMHFPLSWLGPLIMFFWLVTCINAMNLLDGLDGFASVVGIALSVVVAAVGLLSGNFAAAVAALALAGAIGGFLPFNLPPASIYLGDAGSMMIGLTLGALSMQVTDITGQTVVAVVPLAIMTVPLWDTAMAVLRRYLRGVPIGEGDREHLHHRLLARGLSNPQALMFVCLLCLYAGAAVLLAIRAEWELLSLLGAGTAVCALAATRIFGGEELGLLRRASAAWIVRGAAPLALPPRYQGIKLKRHLERLDLESTWSLLIRLTGYLQCSSAEVNCSDDVLFPPRMHRRPPRTHRRNTRIQKRAHEASHSELAISAVQVTSQGTQCEVRVQFHRSTTDAACHAACLAEVLSMFAEHFLRLTAAEVRRPVLRIHSDREEPRELPWKRAA
jgi:UDP-GlcNAc:undecaprenyl-phosphate/decaprenyl-phosphate GlcNAc-1-phosphate transferase